MIKNRILYISVVIFSLMFVFYYGGIVPYRILYSAVAIFPVSIIFTIMSYFCLSYDGYVDSSRIMKGSQFKCIVEIRNKSPLFFPYVNIKYQKLDMFFIEGSSITVSIGPFTGTGSEFTLSGKYRGRYRIDNYSLEIMDFLGLVKIPLRKTKPCYITVTPRIVPISGILHNAGFDFDNSTQISQHDEDTSSVSDIRDYQIGDAMKKIHWKLSAKMGRMQVKNYENITKTNVLLLLDLTCIDSNNLELKLRTEDKMIEAYVSVLRYFLKNQLSVVVCYYDDELVSVNADNLKMFDPLYEKISELEFKSNVGIEEVLDYINLESVSTSNICIFSSKFSESLVDRLHVYAERGGFISLICANEGDIGNGDDNERLGGRYVEKADGRYIEKVDRSYVEKADGRYVEQADGRYVEEETAAGFDGNLETRTRAESGMDVKTNQMNEVGKMTDIEIKQVNESRKMADVETKQVNESRKMADVETKQVNESGKMADVEKIVETERLKVYVINYDSKLDEVFIT